MFFSLLEEIRQNIGNKKDFTFKIDVFLLHSSYTSYLCHHGKQYIIKTYIINRHHGNGETFPIPANYKICH